METATTLPTQGRASQALRIGLWIAQVLACIAYGLVGLIKLTKPIPELAAMWPWTGEVGWLAVRSLGLIDLAGGLGVLLPSLTRIRPRVTVLAALGCIALQVCAIGFHLLRGELAGLPVNAVYLALVVFIFWGRRRAPIEARRSR